MYNYGKTSLLLLAIFFRQNFVHVSNHDLIFLTNIAATMISLTSSIHSACETILWRKLTTQYRLHCTRDIEVRLQSTDVYRTKASSVYFRPLAYNTFGDFFNHVRANLPIEDLQSVLYMYSKMIHDSSLPPSIQVMSLKFLTNIAESTRQKGTEKVRVIEYLSMVRFDTLFSLVSRFTDTCGRDSYL
jgi:hypothetical protein